MKNFYFLIAIGFSMNASAMLLDANPGQVIQAVLTAQKKSNLQCTSAVNGTKMKLNELSIDKVMAQVKNPDVKVDENLIPQIIISGEDSLDNVPYSNLYIAITTTADFMDILKAKLERFKWETSQVNVGTITKPRYQEVKTKKYLGNISCE